jgi:hypothetical protein
MWGQTPSAVRRAQLGMLLTGQTLEKGFFLGKRKNPCLVPRLMNQATKPVENRCSLTLYIRRRRLTLDICERIQCLDRIRRVCERNYTGL